MCAERTVFLNRWFAFLVQQCRGAAMIRKPVHMNLPTWHLAAVLTLALGLLAGCNEAKNSWFCRRRQMSA